jgi:transketolase
MGDGESMEGNVWEALNFAGFYKLDNLCAIIDVNRLGQSDPAPLQHDMNAYRFKLLLFLSFICYNNYNKWKNIKVFKLLRG